ncbi:hypothetical protein BD311DRAFT_539227 [Dichomitus squalens]|uniref:Uncharacterized protein n=1 Tax=Dichomitus squalens TaxID=114155 RepID=A0A4Q9MF49_9APHY|nr:hypothetical protein BD311DRAFT_539227 [Dichomitus squalens]
MFYYLGCLAFSARDAIPVSARQAPFRRYVLLPFFSLFRPDSMHAYCIISHLLSLLTFHASTPLPRWRLYRTYASQHPHPLVLLVLLLYRYRHPTQCPSLFPHDILYYTYASQPTWHPTYQYIRITRTLSCACLRTYRTRNRHWKPQPQLVRNFQKRRRANRLS